MKKGSIDVINLKKFVGNGGEFGPNYQFERPFEFNALVNHYMKYYYDAEHDSERYLDKLGYAIQWANKSIMLDKLGLQSYEDVEEHNPELFKSIMLGIAATDDNFVVENNEIRFSAPLIKSSNGNHTDLNKSCEALWKKTFDTTLDKTRT